MADAEKQLPPGLMEFVVSLQRLALQLIDVVKESRDAFRDYRLYSKDALTDERAETLLALCNIALLATKHFVLTTRVVLDANAQELDEWGFTLKSDKEAQ